MWEFTAYSYWMWILAPVLQEANSYKIWRIHFISLDLLTAACFVKAPIDSVFDVLGLKNNQDTRKIIETVLTNTLDTPEVRNPSHESNNNNINNNNNLNPSDEETEVKSMDPRTSFFAQPGILAGNHDQFYQILSLYVLMWITTIF